MQPETCDECGFASDRYTIDQAITTVRTLAPRWRWVVTGAGDEVLNQRPALRTWSVLEYAEHAADVAALHRLGLEVMFAEDRPDFGPGIDAPPAGEHRVLDAVATLDRLDSELSRLYLVVSKAGEAAWSRTATIGGEELVAGLMLRHLVHDVSHHLHDIGRGLHALGAGVPRQTGRVVQLNISNGGVPKRPVGEVVVGWSGVEGDHQNDRVHHGRPFQALSLWSRERIEALQAEGHPIAPGVAGENVTTSGLDWPSLRPGAVVRIGEVLAEITSYATPCKKNAEWFGDRDFRRIDHDTHPGWSRIYASVLRPGRVRRDDEVVVEP